MQSLMNYRTTIIGVAFAVLTYWAGIGAQLPETSADWFAFAVATGLAALGVLAKDGATGSAPK